MADRPLHTDTQLTPVLPDGATVKLVGLGGVGGITARYLSLFLASLGISLRLVLIDGDAFEPANAARMLFDRCGNKADVVRASLLSVLADTPLMLQAVPSYVTPENIDRLIVDGDVVLLAVDNHAVRKLVSDHCRDNLADVILISGGNDGVGADASGRKTRGTYGNCQVYIRREGQAVSPSLTRFHPEIEQPLDKSPSDQACTDLVKTVPQILCANLAAASAILNAFWLICCNALHYGEIAFDIADGLMTPIISLPHQGIYPWKGKRSGAG